MTSASQKTQSAEKLFSRDFILITLANFVLFFSFMMFPSALPVYANQLGVSDSLLGLILFFSTAAAVCIRPFVGWLLDRKGRKIAILSGLCVMIVACVLFPIWPAFSAVLAIRIVQGFGWATANTSISTAASDIIPKSRMGEGLGYFGYSISLALAFAPGVGITCVSDYGIGTLCTVSGILVVVTMLLSLPIRYKPVAKAKTASSPNGTAKPAAEAQGAKKAGFFERGALVPACVVFFVTATYGCMVTFLAVVAESRGVDGIEWFYTVYAIATLVSRPLAGKVVDRRGATPVIIYGCCMLIPAMVFFAFANALWMYFIIAVLFGTGYSTLISSLQTVAIINSPDDRRGAANSTYYMGFDFGTGLGSVISGIAASALGYTGMYLLMACLPLIGGIVYGVATGVQKRKPR